MDPWWVTMKSGLAGCVEANDEIEAGRIAMRVCNEGHHLTDQVKSVKILPYPAQPRWNEHLYEWCVPGKEPIGPPQAVPSFCWRPHECAGNSSCPRPVSCVE